MEKIKDTKLGAWIKEKAPHLMETVGELLPDSGGLGVVKNLLTIEKVDPEEVKARIDAEVEFQKTVTERWKADMLGDVKLAKLIRPVTLVSLMVLFCLTMVFDSMGSLSFDVKDSYIDLLQVLMLTAFGAYFAGRTIEKTKR
jgi:hypothetical protein